MIQNKRVLVVASYDEFCDINTELRYYAQRAGIAVELMHAEGYLDAAAKLRGGLPYDGVLTAVRITYDYYGMATAAYTQRLRGLVEDRGKMFHSLLPGGEGVAAFVNLLKRDSALLEGTYEGSMVSLTWRKGIGVYAIKGIRGLTFVADGLIVMGKVTVSAGADGQTRVVARTRFGHTFHASPASVAEVAVNHR